MLGVFLNCSPPFVFETGLSLNLEPTDSSRLAAEPAELRGPFYLYVPELEA